MSKSKAIPLYLFTVFVYCLCLCLLFTVFGHFLFLGWSVGEIKECSLELEAQVPQHNKYIIVLRHGNEKKWSQTRSF